MNMHLRRGLFHWVFTPPRMTGRTMAEQEDAAVGRFLAGCATAALIANSVAGGKTRPRDGVLFAVSP